MQLRFAALGKGMCEFGGNALLFLIGDEIGVGDALNLFCLERLGVNADVIEREVRVGIECNALGVFHHLKTIIGTESEGGGRGNRKYDPLDDAEALESECLEVGFDG